MNDAIRREMLFDRPPEDVWRAITDPATLAQWMFPNDFEPRVGHRFTFQVPGNPKLGFAGLTVRCEVLECDPPSRLLFSWCVGGPVDNTRVSYRLEPVGHPPTATRLIFEHSGFDVTQLRGQQALKGAEYGWAKMFKLLEAIIAEHAARTPPAKSENHS